ncbi:MAG: gliding motility-associated C-terminal domain-containing protein, partial [Bacteroidota bacterium]
VQADVGSGDMTGSYVTSDKPIALMSGNRWTQVPSDCPFRDNLLEQMYPVTAYGRQFITVPNASVRFDVFRVLASEDDTRIRIFRGTGVSEVLLNAGRFYEFSGSAPSYIVGDKPILVAQFNVGQNCNSHSLGDPSMVVLNSIEQTRDTVTLFNSRFENITENYINIITRTADADFVLFDGSPLIGQGVNFFPIEANPDFSFARVRVETGAHTIISEGCGVIATAYGYGDVESYAYSGGASFSPINANPIPEGGCLNDTIFFDTGLSPVRYNFQWDLGDGTTTNEAKFSHFYDALGSYPVSLILEDECLGTIDTLYRDLSVTLRQAVSPLPDTALCEDGTILLGATDLAGARYEWKGPNDYIEEIQFPVLNGVKPNQTGQYEVIGIISGCATFPAFMEVEVVAKPRPNLGLDTAYCVKDQLTPLDLSPGNFTTYAWQDRSTSENYLVEQEGIYIVEVTNDFGCVNTDSLVVTQICPTKVYVPNAFSPNRDGVNDRFEIYGNDIEAIQLYIYDRWGGLLFETKELSGWNGRANGEWAPGGIYTWVLIVDGIDEEGLPQQQKLSGTVMLLK